eukprot:7216026-Prymnesium_polylepis.1
MVPAPMQTSDKTVDCAARHGQTRTSTQRHAHHDSGGHVERLTPPRRRTDARTDAATGANKPTNDEAKTDGGARPWRL